VSPPGAISRRFASADRSFLWLGSLGALLFLLLTPPFQVPDEPVHWFRAYQISEGRLTAIRKGASAGAMIPVSMLETRRVWQQGIAFHPEVKVDLERARRTLALPLEPEKRRFKDTRNVSAYAPVPYLPQALGVWLGRSLGVSPIVLLYFARAANALVAFGLCLLALRLVPFGRWPFFLMLMSPIFGSLRSSASPDATTYSLAFVNLASSLAIACSPSTSGRRTCVIYVASALLLLLSKHAYLFVPLALGIGLWNPAGRGLVLRLLAAAYLPGAFLVAAWLRLAADTLVPTLPGSDPFAQLRLIALDPLGYVALVLVHFASSWPAYVQGLVGALGWMDTPLPRWLAAVYWIALASVTVLASEPRRPRPAQRLALLALAALGYLVVVTLIYLIMPLGAEEIRGVQSRYLVPLLPFAAFAALALRPSAALERRAPALCAGVAGLCLAVSGATLVNRYYVSLW